MAITTGNPEIDSRYEILKLINKGASGHVYLALDRNLNKQWAIKKIRKYSGGIKSNALMEEAQIMKNLDHPVLPRIVEITEDSEFFYIVMDYVQGENLKTILRANGPQNQKTVVLWMIDLCSAIGYLHSQNIIYRDMKPENIILTPEGNIKLIDFGIAREYKEGHSEDTQPLGSRGYAAPEQYEGAGLGQSDARTDIYGLGMTMFHLLTGCPPRKFSGDVYSIRNVDPALSSGLDRIILKCVERDQNKRYQDTDELEKALRHYKKYDIEYLSRRKSIIRRFYILIGISFFCFGVSVVSYFEKGYQINKEYKGLLSGDVSTTQAVKAIRLKPKEPDGYIKLLQSYGDEMTSKDSASFSEIYGKEGTALGKEDHVIVSMEAGEKILSTYSEKSDSAKLKAAAPYFRNVVEQGDDAYQKYKEAILYDKMATFYEKYIMKDDSSMTAESAARTEYIELLRDMNQMVTMITGGKINQSLSFTTEQMILGILFEEAEPMHRQNIEKRSLSKIVKIIGENAEGTSPESTMMEKKRADTMKAVRNTTIRIDDTYDIRKSTAKPAKKKPTKNKKKPTKKKPAKNRKKPAKKKKKKGAANV